MPDEVNEPLFIIDGKEYPSPTLESLDMQERRVLYDYAGIVQEDFARLEGESEDGRADRLQVLVRHPGFMQALMHMAYQRGNPKLTREKVQTIIEHTNYLEAIEKFGADEEEDEDSPPESGSTRTPDESLPSEKPTKNGSSGRSSTSGSDAPAEIPALTGRTS